MLKLLSKLMKKNVQLQHDISRQLLSKVGADAVALHK